MYTEKKEAAGGTPAAAIDTYPNHAVTPKILQEPDSNGNGATDFQNPSAKTDKTDRTNTVTSRDFLKALFGDDPGDSRPVVVSFSGHPSRVSKNSWFGAAWKPEGPGLPPDQNNYFSLATFRPNEAGEYRRQKKQFHALHAIMLDDVGTKVERARLSLSPSWMLETSPGNYQAGYILDEPLQDAVTADRLMNAIVAALLCDPGAGGPTARLARLPAAVNGKHDPAHPCRLEIWEPGLRYSVEELSNGLQLDMIPARSMEKQAGRTRAQKPDAGDEIFIPRPEENPVIAALKNRRLYKAPLGSGKHDIICPWAQEHTGGTDGGTAYFEPDDVYPVGGFKCLHGHCADRHVRDLLEFFSIPSQAACMKPSIRCIAGEIHRLADRAEQELAKRGQYYQRGGLIVTVSTDPGTRETCVKTIGQPALTALLCSVALWERFDGRNEGWIRTDPPAKVVSALHNATEYRHLPVLSGIAHQPYLRPDGTLVRNAGFDPSTGMYGVFNARNFSVPDAPTRQDAERALTFIQAQLEEFSFAQDADRAAALTAILTAAIRPSLSAAPMYHVRAAEIASGKSYLCAVIGAYATPRRSAPTTFPQDDEECRKLLLSELLRAPAVIEFDNMTSDLIPHKSLCTALTSEFLTGRVLGESKTATVSTRTLFLSSGNNVGPVRDMARRCLTINLDPACEIPASRTYKNVDLLGQMHRERERYISAALTIILAWIAAGRPETECKSVASYGEWSALCRQPLLWLGLPDPTESMFEAMSEDPDRETLGRLLLAWRDCFGSAPKMVRDAVNAAGYNNEELHEILTDIAGERDKINRRILGHWIKRNAGRMVGSLRFAPAGGSRSAAAWRVESVS